MNKNKGFPLSWRGVRGGLLLLLMLLPLCGYAQTLEYWFDERFEQRNTTSISASDALQELNLDLRDDTKFPPGFHKLNMRVTIDGEPSAVYSSVVLKLAAGSISKLEYWLDDDIANVKTIQGTESTEGGSYQFLGDLDLTDATPGHHRLHCRAVSSSGRTTTAVTTVPVMVKSMGEVELAATDAKITSYKISVDGKTEEIRYLGNPQAAYSANHLLDASKYSKGKHMMKATFWNSAGASVSVEQQFEVLAPTAAPTITLTAEEKNGVVNLAFNSVPNDVKHFLVRKDVNGAIASVENKDYGVYPATVSFSDAPPAAGSYTYYVLMSYKDVSGSYKPLTSNEVTVNVTKTHTEVEAIKEYGYITGRIVSDKNSILKELMVNVSGDATKTLTAKNGIFNLQKIPVGMTLTLAVEGDNAHDYETKTLTIKAGENNVTINGTLREDYYPDNMEHDLCLDSRVETLIKEEDGKKSHTVKFSVRNLSAHNKWKGKIRVQAINKDVPVIPIFVRTKYEGETQEELELDGLETARVEITIDELVLEKETNFKLYVYSDGRWVDFDEVNVEKLVEYTRYPIETKMDKTEHSYAKWNDETREEFAYLMLGLGSLTDGLDYVVGDFSPYLPTMQEFVKKYGHTTDVKAGIKKVVEWLSSDKTALEALNEFNSFNVSSSGVSLTKTLKNIVLPKSSILQKFKKDVIVKSSDIAEANAILGAVVGIAKAVGGSNDTFERAMNCASVLYTICADVSVPVASMFYTYSVVGKSLINKALQIQGATHDLHLAARLNGNKVFTGEQTGANANRQNTAVDFKIVVKKKNGKPIDFTKTDAQSQIKNIYVVAKGAMSSAEHYFKRIYMKDGLMLRYDGKNGTLQEGFVLSQFYLVIEWNNKRKTFIPMIEACDGVAIDFSNLNQTDAFEDYKPATYTVTLTTATGEDKMADELYLGKDTNRK